MMERALKERWPIKPEYRDAIIKRLMRIIADPESKPREVASASRALLAAEQQNQNVSFANGEPVTEWDLLRMRSQTEN